MILAADSDLGAAYKAQLNELGVPIHYGTITEVHHTDRLWAAGDVQGWTGAIESANAGGMAAFFIVHGWHGEPKAD